MNELKNCPFCGDKAEVQYSRYTIAYDVSCTKCGASTGGRYTRDEAISAWNRRTDQEASEKGGTKK